jgi:hypothetical protein
MSSSGNAHGHRWWFEDHVYIPATAPWAHEAASQSPEREAKPLCPHKGLHVEFGRVFAFLEAYGRFNRATYTAGADAPTQPICLSQGLD